MAVILAVSPSTGNRPAGPLQSFAPWIVFSEAERQRMNRGDVVVRMLPRDGAQLAVLVATRLTSSPDGLAVWQGAMEELRRSRYVMAGGRFSDPPALTDLDGLHLDEADFEALRSCRPGDCGLKLSEPEIRSLATTISGARNGGRQAVDAEFRRIVLARVNAYRAGGLSLLPTSADGNTFTPPDQAFTSVMAQSPYLERLPEISRWLREYPRSGTPDVESYLYWSKEHYGAGKAIISVTHVGDRQQRA